MPELPADGAPPAWARADLAWALAIVAGFAGAWLGLRIPLPGAAVLLAAGFFAPLQAALLGRGERVLVAATTGVWCLGLAGAVVGSVHEAANPELLAARLPGAAHVAASDLAFLTGEGGPGPFATLPRNLGLLLLLAVLARPLWGVPGLVGLGLVVGALAGAAAAHAGFPPETPALEVFLAWPPHLALALAGAVLAAAALAEPAPLAPLAVLDGTRRQLLLVAGSLAALGLGGQGFWVQSWRTFLDARLH